MNNATLTIPGRPGCELWVGNLEQHRMVALGKKYDSFALLADQSVHQLHAKALGEISACPTHLVPAGEDCKTFHHLQSALGFCAEAGLSRRSLLFTLGGGATSDLGGLAAALFKRGLAVAHIPTTLVGQVDAAIGGKTAIDMPQGKNLVGAFHMPCAVFMDVRFLRTLPDTERRAGLGEVVKCALLGGDDRLSRLEEDATALAQGDPDALQRAVLMGAGLKVDVVTQDPTEQGSRKLLNLGHTFAHAIETCTGHGTVPHGIAVGIGLVLALRASAASGILDDAALPMRLEKLMSTLGLPTTLRGLDLPQIPKPEELWNAMGHDKKGRVGRPEFVLLEKCGTGRWGIELDEALIEKIWNT